ncbi:hypothetical protein CBR_g24384 [Chara braunii]|uniref:Uncharacterized protein n=1 Tax=Chara braunii TaxID=69332 RepID=A0A388JML7_CHABU|nr:hypothetical protein CBR_g24384 [Chara braunii]|eukprot:GBG59038.1 hypothetical protein CBR_g24384 [Chara braunii]
MEASSSTLRRAVMLSSETLAMAVNGHAASMLTTTQKGSALRISSLSARSVAGGRIPDHECYHDSPIMLTSSPFLQSASMSSSSHSQSLFGHVSSPSSSSSSSSSPPSSAGERDAPFRNTSTIHLLPRRTRDCSLTRSCWSRDRLAAGLRRSGSAVHVAGPQVSLLLLRSRSYASSSSSSFFSSCCFAACKGASWWRMPRPSRSLAVLPRGQRSRSGRSGQRPCRNHVSLPAHLAVHDDDREGGGMSPPPHVDEDGHLFLLPMSSSDAVSDARWPLDGDGGVVGLTSTPVGRGFSSCKLLKKEEIAIPTQVEVLDRRRGGEGRKEEGIPAAAAAAAGGGGGGGGGYFAARAVLQVENGGLCRSRDRHSDRDRDRAIFFQRGRKCVKRGGKLFPRQVGAVDFVKDEGDDAADSSSAADDGGAIDKETFVFANMPHPPQWIENWKPPSYLWRALAAFVVAGQVFVRILRGRVHVKNTLIQLEEVGPKSVGVSLLTASFVGMVFTIQFIREFARLGLTRSVGGVLALALARELSPVVTAIILAGRVGSAFAAELGTMQVSEQTDTLRVLRTDPVDYLVTPRVIACCIALPVLTLMCFSVAMGASVFLAEGVYNVSANIILDSAARGLQPWDIISTLIKCVVFGAIIAVVSCTWGATTTGGAKGVGESTTSAVVISLVCIFIADFVLSWCFFQGSGDALKAALG